MVADISAPPRPEGEGPLHHSKSHLLHPLKLGFQCAADVKREKLETTELSAMLKMYTMPH